MYQGDPRQVISHILLLQALIIIIIIIMQVSMCLMKMVRPERIKVHYRAYEYHYGESTQVCFFLVSSFPSR